MNRVAFSPVGMDTVLQSGAPHPLEIVVADDLDEIRALVTHWLAPLGHAVHCASGGREAMRLAKEKHCDLVITDVLMPDGDGLDVIMGLKRTNPAMRFLAISGGGKYMGAAAALSLAQAIGADAVLFKPFNRAQFLSAVGQLIPGAAPTAKS